MIGELVSAYPYEIVQSIVVGTLTYFIYQFIIYPLYFHPLAGIPGPKIAALTKYWILYISWSEQRNNTVHKLHLKYGPIIRVGPNEIDISDVDYLKDVYINNYDKSSFYTQFTNYDAFNTFSTVDKKLHRDSRKISHKFYSKSNIASDQVQDKIERVMSESLKVLEAYKNTSINVFIFFQEVAMDGINSFAFGKDSFASVLVDPFGAGERIINSFLTQSSAWFWTTSMPQWYDLVVAKEVKQASKRATTWLKEQFDKALVDQSKSSEGAPEALFSVLLNGGKSETSALSEMFDHVAAGHHTSGTTLAYFFWRCASNMDVQDKLIEELKEYNGGKYLDIKDYKCSKYSEVEDLPYMNAVLSEVFRLHAAIPGQEPRIAPKQGMQWKGSKNTPPAHIPGGTTITMQPWSLHRDPVVFPDPESFDPTRWLVDSSKDPKEESERIREMNKYMMQFGSGVRMCIGMNLAVCEIKLIICNILSRYKVQLVEGLDYDTMMKMRDIYTTSPYNNIVDLKFEPLLK